MRSIVYGRESARLLSSGCHSPAVTEGSDLVIVTSFRRPCVSRKNTEAVAIVMERDALISPATSSVLGLRAGMTPFSGIRRVSHGRTVLCECPQGDRHDPNRRLALNRPPTISLRTYTVVDRSCYVVADQAHPANKFSRSRAPWITRSTNTSRPSTL